MKILDEQAKKYDFIFRQGESGPYKKQKLFSRHDNLLLTREDDLVYNENNSSERIFLESYCYLLTVTKEVEE